MNLHIIFVEDSEQLRKGYIIALNKTFSEIFHIPLPIYEETQDLDGLKYFTTVFRINDQFGIDAIALDFDTFFRGTFQKKFVETSTIYNKQNTLIFFDLRDSAGKFRHDELMDLPWFLRYIGNICIVSGYPDEAIKFGGEELLENDILLKNKEELNKDSDDIDELTISDKTNGSILKSISNFLKNKEQYDFARPIFIYHTNELNTFEKKEIRINGDKLKLNIEMNKLIWVLQMPEKTNCKVKYIDNVVPKTDIVSGVEGNSSDTRRAVDYVATMKRHKAFIIDIRNKEILHGESSGKIVYVGGYLINPAFVEKVTFNNDTLEFKINIIGRSPDLLKISSNTYLLTNLKVLLRSNKLINFPN